MILFYGMGGGFGHLTRIRAFVHTFQITEPYRVITANHSAHRFFTDKRLLFINAEEKTTRAELADKIRIATSGLVFDTLYIDTFPFGILGELTPDLINVQQKNYLTRRMIWDNYKDQIIDRLPFNKVYRFEPLETEHQQFIDEHSQLVIDASLTYPSSQNSFFHPVFDSVKPIWLITHTTNPKELSILIDHAQDIANIEKVNPQLVILSDQKIPLPDSAIGLHDQNPADWYPKVDKIFSAAGFNTWHQLKSWREKHVSIPFVRRFDDQFWRAVQTS